MFRTIYHIPPLSLSPCSGTNPSFFLLMDELGTPAELLQSCHLDLFMFCSGLWARAKALTSYQATKKNTIPCFFFMLHCWQASSKAAVLTKTSVCSCGLAEVNAVIWLCFGRSYLWTWHSTWVGHISHPIGAASELWPPALLSPEIKCSTQLPASAKLKKMTCQESFLSARVNNEPCIFTLKHFTPPIFSLQLLI